ncbi:hypothetical protein L1987_04011 [Smallanthus sonchifolius]|uniref:Uncharacterized protein n=1 Tax=Smallanthus sonchifolius TaxID=185202 RepID=A0ACB9KCH7_9ASTR|nr:hypothetical protein L1987_04011 [Smallanthus sonchifolius]
MMGRLCLASGIFFFICKISSGKSSVLESGVGKNFLPRGSDLDRWRALHPLLQESSKFSSGIKITITRPPL